MRLVFDHGRPTGVYEDFATGFVLNARRVWGRPVGVAVAKDGALLVSENGNGTLWRISAKEYPRNRPIGHGGRHRARDNLIMRERLTRPPAHGHRFNKSWKRMTRAICYKLLRHLGGLCLALSLAACNVSAGGGSGGSGPTPVSHARFAFAANNDGTVSIFGTDNGTLRYAGYTAVGKAAVQGLAVTPDNRHLYVLSTDGTVSAYRIDAARGALTLVGTVSAGGAGGDIRLSADGRFLYAAAGDAADTVSVYAVSSATGGLSAAGSASTGAQPVRIALAPSGAFAYVLNGTGQSVSVYARDGTSGTLTPGTTTSLPAAPTGIALNKAGTFAYITFAASAGNMGVYAVDAATGDLSPVQTATAGDGPADVVLNADDTFAYAASAKGDRIDVFGIDPASGRLTAVQSVTGVPSPRALALAPDGRTLYGATFTDDELQTYAVDAGTGKLTLAGGVRARGGLNAVALAEGSAPYSLQAAYLFAPDDNVPLFPVDGTDGSLGGPTTEAAGTGPVQVALTPDDRFAYVVNGTSDTISVFQFDAASGTLGPLVETDPAPSTWQQSPEPIRAAIEPSGRFLYLLDHRSTAPLEGRVAVYAIDGVSGGLTYEDESPTGDLNPLNLVVHPAGGYLYAVNSGGNTITAFTIDPATGGLSQLSSVQAGTAGSGQPVTLAFTPDGRYAYATLQGDQQLVRYTVAINGDLTNPAAVNITTAEVPVDPRPRYIAVDPAGRYAYVSHWSGDVSTWTIDPATHALTFAGTAAVGNLPAWIALDPNGRFAYTVVTGGVDRLTVGTGGALSLQETTSTGTGQSDFLTATIVAAVQ